MLFLALILAALAAPVPPAQTGSGTIEGQVVRMGTSEPIPNAQVTLVVPATVTTPTGAAADALQERIRALTAAAPAGTDQSTIDNLVSTLQRNAGTTPGAQLTATTDPAGHFRFSNLDPGNYTVRAQREGYFAPTTASQAGAASAVLANVTVTANKQTPAVKLAMIAGGILGGRVRDPEGHPLPNTTVTEYLMTYRDGRPVFNAGTSKVTDDRGEYRIFWLPPGDYYVAAVPLRATTSPRPQDTYARTFFPSMVSLQEGAEVSGLDILIQGNATATISGTVQNLIPSATGSSVTASAAASPTTPNTFYLVPRDENVPIDSTVPTYANLAADRSNGHFEIRNVPAGAYDLITMASVVTSSWMRSIPGRVPVDVGTGNVENVTLTIAPGVDVRAQVIIDGAAATASVPTGIRLALRARENYPSPFESAINAAPVAGSPGTFLFSNVPAAKYIVVASGLPNVAFVTDIRANGASVYDSGFAVTSQPMDVEVHIRMNGSALRGKVMNAQQKPAASATVVLVPEESRRRNASLYRTVTTDAMGNFTLTGIAPGEYKVFAWESIAATAYQNPAYMERYEARGKGVTLRDDAGETVQLEVIPK